jgi:peptidoglycan/LPS O-acetylase OafA/YrhL
MNNQNSAPLPHNKTPVPVSSGYEDPVIEAFRGFAACMVMLTHFAFMVTPHGGMWGFFSTGVDLFFVLSGYVFAPYMLGRPLQVLPHLVRRFFRLVPLYWFALAVYILLRWLTDGTILYAWRHAFFLHTTQSLEIASWYNPAFWSLPPEVEYYVLLPLLAWWSVRNGLWAMVALSIAVHLMLVFAANPDSNEVTARAIATVHVPGLLCEFLLGSLAAYLVRHAPKQHQRAMRFFSGLFLLVVVGCLYAVYVADWGVPPKTPLWIGGNLGLFAACSYALILSSLAGSANSLQQHPRAVFLLLGQWSYGVYLFHNAVPSFARWLGWDPVGWIWLLGSMCATFAWAWLLHRLLEAPMRSWGRQLSLRLSSR